MFDSYRRAVDKKLRVIISAQNLGVGLLFLSVDLVGPASPRTAEFASIFLFLEEHGINLDLRLFNYGLLLRVQFLASLLFGRPTLFLTIVNTSLTIQEIMSNHSVSQIRDLIADAQTHDQESAQLLSLLGRRASRLHDAIKLPGDGAAVLLGDFIARYIEQVPNFIEAITDISLEAGIYDGVQPILNIACDYFLSPPDIVHGHNNLETLLDEAYLAHRLLEEMNDRFIGYCGIPLAPMDMTRANIIAHELIGEPFANELDQAVLFSAELLLNEYGFSGPHFQQYIARHKSRGWSEELKRWPCLTDDLAISVAFDVPPKTIN